jgi:hypothetical protein
MPQGIAEKAIHTSRFLKRKLNEYKALKAEIQSLSGELVANNKTSLQNRSHC